MIRGRGKVWGVPADQLAELHRRAGEMRRNPTEPEIRLWRYLASARLGGHRFRRQAVIGWFIADFLCPQRALIVEVDGDTHDLAKDRLRDAQLGEHGYRVVRVTNLDVMTNMDGVLDVISRALAASKLRWVQPHPNPSPERGGA